MLSNFGQRRRITQRSRHERERTACGGANSPRAFSNAQRQQFNDAQSDYQCNERDVIVIEPMPFKHGNHPLFKRSVFSWVPGCVFVITCFVAKIADATIFLISTLAHPRFRAISQQSISVSWFVAKTRPTFRSLWRKSGTVIEAPDAWPQ